MTDCKLQRVFQLLFPLEFLKATTLINVYNDNVGKKGDVKIKALFRDI